ncbi:MULTISPECIES: hypothetical protein [unclassified Novosphingobium]|uniref:hypothetical protein n=1 Tax=unclassified Novosphingobium TaxID=2644732 RepID=UPI0025FFAABB|nr:MULTISPECIES: hypothetical protein [unclassified Novosphingobium]
MQPDLPKKAAASAQNLSIILTTLRNLAHGMSAHSIQILPAPGFYGFRDATCSPSDL